MRCIVDCRTDRKLANNFIELSLCRKLCYAYVVEVVRNAGCFQSIEVLTVSMKIKEYCKKYYPVTQFIGSILESNSEPSFVISGRALCILADAIRDAVRRFSRYSLVSSRSEAIVDFNGRKISFFSQIKQQKFNVFKIFIEQSMKNRRCFQIL